MADSSHPNIEEAEGLLRPVMPDVFRVTYTPDMPSRDGTSFSWFQVVFAVGPGGSPDLRKQVHDLFPRMLGVLSKVSLAREADFVSLRARRFCPETKNLDPKHPVMFIEADWRGSALKSTSQSEDFSDWMERCVAYRNNFDGDDPLTRQ